ncbi:MucR family transcriptional regulator [Modestobacter sp. NPDC049651]|uniref:MucR family transcriptional regulator n=1 Tax=unclassified Modestobacter TaxID=2643866 RepID=UPI0033D571EE
MLHPVGPLPSAVYWRRRVLVLTLLVALVGGGSWVGAALLAGNDAGTARAAVQRPDAGPPALEQVLPSPAAVRLPDTDPPPAAVPDAADAGPCADDMIGLEVRPGAPSAATGTPVPVQLVVTNTSPDACTRALDAQLQEVVLLDGSGARVWGSNDCRPGAGSDTRTLAPGEAVTVTVEWPGRTSEPGCAADPATPGPGDYVLRGRLDTKTTDDARLTLT